jgi:DNA modification methylase
MEKTEKNIKNRFTKIGQQKTLGNEEAHDILEFKNLKEKRELKEKVKAMFSGMMFRSIITPREADRNIRLNKLERDHSDRKNVLDTAKRADKFSHKSLDVISTFPSILTQIYTILLSKEGDKVFDSFMGHNSRAEDVLVLGRQYYAYDVHEYPFNFTAKALSRFDNSKYELILGSSEKVKFEGESMDFSITCPPYFNVENYNKIYKEEKKDDLSDKNYDNFLFCYNKCISETYRVLKKGAFFVIVIGDIHKEGKYLSLMLDTIKICKMNGFTLHDINIYNRKSNIGGDLNYKQFILKSKRFPTIHEFILIFKK